MPKKKSVESTAEVQKKKRPGRKPQTPEEKEAAAKLRAAEKAKADNLKPELVLQYQGTVYQAGGSNGLLCNQRNLRGEAPSVICQPFCEKGMGALWEHSSLLPIHHMAALKELFASALFLRPQRPIEIAGSGTVVHLEPIPDS